MKYTEINSNGYFLCDAPHANGDEPNIAPHTAVDGTKPDGMMRARYVNGSWIDESATELAVIIAAQNIPAIKAKAGQIITARIPEWKQRNMLARKSELQDIIYSGGVLTTEQQAEWEFMAGEWTWAKSVRSTSDAAELAGTPVEEIVWPT